VDVNASNQITTISTIGGLSIRSATSGAGVVMNSTGLIGCTNLADPPGTKTFQIANADGSAWFKGTVSASTVTACTISASTITVTASSWTPNPDERLSLYYDTTLKGYLSAGDTGVQLYSVNELYLKGIVVLDHPLWLSGSGPQIIACSGTPTMSATYGSIALSDGGSFWVMQAAGWRRIDNWVS
jgi:hypothetical protein